MTEYNKVVYDGQTLIDLTQDDVQASDVRNGVYFHSADGVRSQGTLASTSTPTADTIAEWDSDAHMNSTDMTTGSGGEVEEFIDGLDVSGGGIDSGVVTVYGDYCKCRRIGHIVQVWGESSNGWSIASGGYRAMTTLPEQFRPAQNVRFVCGALGGTQQITGYVNSSGIVYLYTTSTTAYWNFSITYLVG